MKKYYWLLASYLPFILFMVWPFFRRDWPLLVLSLVSLFLLVTYIFNKKISYFDKSKGFKTNWVVYSLIVISSLLNFFVIFLSAFNLHYYHWVAILLALALFLLCIIKSFNNLVKTF